MERPTDLAVGLGERVGTDTAVGVKLVLVGDLLEPSMIARVWNSADWAAMASRNMLSYQEELPDEPRRLAFCPRDLGSPQAGQVAAGRTAYLFVSK